MKAVRFLVAFASLLLTGCAALSPAERNLLDRHHVGFPTYHKMMNYEPLMLADMVELSTRNVPSGFIIRYVRDTGAVYNLNTGDILKLTKAGVTADVLDYLLATPAIASRYYDSPLYRYDPFYYSYPRVLVIHHDHRRR